MGAAYVEWDGEYTNVAGEAALSAVRGGLARQLQSAYAATYTPFPSVPAQPLACPAFYANLTLPDPDKSWSYYVYSCGKLNGTCLPHPADCDAVDGRDWLPSGYCGASALQIACGCCVGRADPVNDDDDDGVEEPTTTPTSSATTTKATPSPPGRTTPWWLRSTAPNPTTTATTSRVIGTPAPAPGGLDPASIVVGAAGTVVAALLVLTVLWCRRTAGRKGRAQVQANPLFRRGGADDDDPLMP